MSLNEYRPRGNDKSVYKKQGVLHLNTLDALLAGHQRLRDKIETIAKKLEAEEVASCQQMV